MENQSAKKNLRSENHRSQEITKPCHSECRVFIAAEESLSVPAARVSHSASAHEKVRTIPLTIASINFDQ
jgi:hypothetical protein